MPSSWIQPGRRVVDGAILIGLSFLLLGEFSAGEIALVRSLVYGRSAAARAAGEV